MNVLFIIESACKGVIVRVRRGAMTDEASRPKGLEFPTDFPIKIMGRRDDAFAQTIVGIVLEHAPDFDPSTLEMRASKDGNYLSVTATVNASVLAGTVLTNTMAANTSSPQPNTNDDTASASSTVQAQADLAVTKTGPATVITGQPISYDITVHDSS